MIELQRSMLMAVPIVIIDLHQKTILANSILLFKSNSRLNNQSFGNQNEYVAKL